VINSLFSLPESRFRFDILDLQYPDFRSTKFRGLQPLHILKTETTPSISFPIHSEGFPEMVQWIRKLPKYRLPLSVRNLTPGEMLDQILTIQNDTKNRIGNVVIMGIGEPLDNYENVVKFLRLVNHKDGINLGARHISVSTCGLVPEILRLAEEKIPVTLSISLHAPNDEIREKIMPINKRYSIDKIIEACKIYTETTNRRITFEYAMIDGLNDSKENALELAKRIRGMLCHVNLIPVNTVSDTGFKRSSREKITAFKEILERFGVETTVRRELGSDINAACGQLRRNLVENGQLVY